MAVVQGIREKVHLPIYDSVFVESGKQLRDVDELDNSGTLKFFVNVQKKSKLETNLQSASLLPHYNTFEARAMRVVISDLPPVFDDEVTAKSADTDDVEPFVEDEDGEEVLVNDDGAVDPEDDNNVNEISVELELTLSRIMELLREARADSEGFTTIDVTNEEEVTLSAATSGGDELEVGVGQLLVEVFRRQHTQAGRQAGEGRGRARQLVDQGHLAEHVAGTELGDALALAVLLAADLQQAVLDDEGGVARVTLAEQPLAFGEEAAIFV